MRMPPFSSRLRQQSRSAMALRCVSRSIAVRTYRYVGKGLRTDLPRTTSFTDSTPVFPLREYFAWASFREFNVRSKLGPENQVRERKFENRRISGECLSRAKFRVRLLLTSYLANLWNR
jgi:hypothetical protein